MAAAAYVAMNVIGWYVIVPLNLGALITGLIQSLGTRWGLFRHYWILIKFLLTVGATVLLFLHMKPANLLAEAAIAGTLTNPDLQPLKFQLVFDASLALIVLFIAIVLSVYKPWGQTNFGKSKDEKPNDTSRWGRFALYGLLLLFLFFIAKHIVSGGLSHH